MTSVQLQQWIEHPEILNRETLYELRTVVTRYPYFQTARMLYLKNLFLLHDLQFGPELRKSVFYVSDRGVLFYLIEGIRYQLVARQTTKKAASETQEELSIDRTLSLIDAFLSTLPEEHSQSTELDYAVDYTTYLAEDIEEQSILEDEKEQDVPQLRGHNLIDEFIKKNGEEEVGVLQQEPGEYNLSQILVTEENEEPDEAEEFNISLLIFSSYPSSPASQVTNKRFFCR